MRWCVAMCFFFQAEDGIRDLVRSRGLGDVYKRQAIDWVLDVSAGRLLLIGALIGLIIAVIDYRLAAARWNRYVAALEVRFPTPMDGKETSST